MNDYEALRDLAQRLAGRSHWPEGDAYSEITVLAKDRDLIALVLREDNDKPFASLLWAASTPAALLSLTAAIDALDQALVTTLPGKMGEIKPWQRVLEELGFGLKDLHIDMRLGTLQPMPEAPLVRMALQSELMDLVAIERVGIGVQGSHSPSELRERLVSSNGAVLALETPDKRVAGLITGELYGPQRDSLFLRSMSVIPDERGKGYGRQLAHAFINWGISLGARKSMLWLNDINNKVARQLYESVGYRANGGVEAEYRYRPK